MAIIHQMAWCSECSEQWEDHKNGNAREKVYAHAKKTGHKVWVETGTATQYHFSKPI